MNFLELDPIKRAGIQAIYEQFLQDYSQYISVNDIGTTTLLDFLIVGSLATGDWDPTTSDLDLLLVFEPMPFDVENQKQFRTAVKNLVNAAYFEQAPVIKMLYGVYFSNVNTLIIKENTPFAYSLKNNTFYTTIEELPYKQFYKRS